MTRPELVLFDLDGTLLDEQGLPQAMRRTCEAIAARSGRVSADDLIAANTATWQLIWPEVEDDWMLGGAGGDTIGEDAWRGTLASAGVDDTELLRFAVDTWVAEERRGHGVFAEVPAVLAALEAAGVRLGVVSNGASSVQRGKLAELGLHERFSPVVVSSEVGVKKPGREIFEHAVGVAGVAPRHAWYVGDNLWTDVPGAKAAGLSTAWVDRPGLELQADWPQPDLVVPTLADLPKLLLD